MKRLVLLLSFLTAGCLFSTLLSAGPLQPSNAKVTSPLTQMRPGTFPFLFPKVRRVDVSKCQMLFGERPFYRCLTSKDESFCAELTGARIADGACPTNSTPNCRDWTEETISCNELGKTWCVDGNYERLEGECPATSTVPVDDSGEAPAADPFVVADDCRLIDGSYYRCFESSTYNIWGSSYCTDLFGERKPCPENSTPSCQDHSSNVIICNEKGISWCLNATTFKRLVECPVGDRDLGDRSIGRLDPKFGGRGFVTTDIVALLDRNTQPSPSIFLADAKALTVQPDGKIIVVGSVTERPSSDDHQEWSSMVIVRYCSNGLLDDGTNCGAPGFGVRRNGVIILDALDGWLYRIVAAKSIATAVALQSNGKIMVAGHVDYSEKRQLFWVRLLSDGSLDYSFGGHYCNTSGSNGIRREELPGRSEVRALNFRGDDTLFTTIVHDPSTVVNDMDFKILENTSSDCSASTPPRAANAFLVFDLFHGDDDPAGAAFTKENMTLVTGSATRIEVIKQDEFNLLAIGHFSPPEYRDHGSDFVTLRTIDGTGRSDPAFGRDHGFVRTDFGGTDRAKLVTIQGDSRILVAGTTTSETDYLFESRNPAETYSQSGDDNTNIAVARYNPNGSPDTGFGKEGLLTLDFGSADETLLSIGEIENSRILIAGFTPPIRPEGRYQFTMAILDEKGRIISSFIRPDLGLNRVSHAVVVGEGAGRTLYMAGSVVSSSERGKFGLERRVIGE